MAKVAGELVKVNAGSPPTTFTGTGTQASDVIRSQTVVAVSSSSGAFAADFATNDIVLVNQVGATNPMVPTITNIPTNRVIRFVFNCANLTSVAWPTSSPAVKRSYGDSWANSGTVNGYNTANGFYVVDFWSNGTNLYELPSNGNVQTVNAAHVNVEALQVYTFNAGVFQPGTAAFLFGGVQSMNQSSYFNFDTDTGIRRNAAGILQIDSGVANGTAGLSTTLLRDLLLRHALAGGTVPTIASGFGTSPSIAGNDEAFRVTVGTGGVATSGIVTFGTAYTNAPICIAQNETTGLLLRATASTTNVTLTSATPFSAADKLTVLTRGYLP